MKKNHCGSVSRLQKQVQLLDLTDDLIEEILVRVPAKTLLSSKCVCKRWSMLISDPSFLTKLVQHPKSLPPLIAGFIATTNSSDVSTFSGFGNKIISNNIISGSNLSELLGLSFIRPPVALSSHNGFLLADTSTVERINDDYVCENSYIVCNLLTKKCVCVTAPPVFLPGLKERVLYCYEENVEQESRGAGSNKEFKVLFFSREKDALELYSSERGTWMYQAFEFSLYFSRRGSLFVHTLFNGCYYFWDPTCGELQLYDFKEERIRPGKLPTVQLHNDDYRYASPVLGVSSGSLYFAESSLAYLSVCVLVDGGMEWCLKHRVEYTCFSKELPPEMFATYGPTFRPLAFHPLNHLLVLVRLGFNEKLALYHIDNLSIEVINNIDSELFYPVVPYSLQAWPPRLRNL